MFLVDDEIQHEVSLGVTILMIYMKYVIVKAIHYMRKHGTRNYAVRFSLPDISRRLYFHLSDIMLNTWSHVKSTVTTTGSLLSVFLILLITILAVEERHVRKEAMARLEQLEKQQKSQADKHALDRIQELEQKQETIQNKLDAANKDMEHVSTQKLLGTFATASVALGIERSRVRNSLVPSGFSFRQGN